MTDIKEKTNDLYKIRALVLLVIVITGSLLFLILMSMHLDNSLKASQIQENERFFDTTVVNFDNNDREIRSLIERFDSNNMIMLNNLVKAYSNDNFRELESMPIKDQSEMLLKATSTMSYCVYILIVNEDGQVLMSDFASNVGSNIFKDRDVVITPEEFFKLCSGNDKKITDNPYVDEERDLTSKLYLYAKAIPVSESEGKKKYILISFDSIMIDEAEARMKDLSSWMNESSLGNSSNVFMIDASSDTVKYGIFSGEDLTGAKASELGFDKTVLTNGYNGDTVIKGTRCFVSSRAYSSDLYGRDTYIVAVIPESEIRRENTPVAIWTFCLFLMFVILIIAYASHVRTGLIRDGADLKRVRVFKSGDNNIYFCGTFAGKIVPVVLFASLIVFLLVLYFQVLMKLSESFSDSVMIEKDISQNVEESARLQEEFQDYSDTQYESRAKLMALMVALDSETYLDPEKEKDSITLFDEVESNGKRYVVKDEYNNEVQVINNSKSLEKLRDANNVEEIFLISDTGATMATSSTFWNFSLSDDSKDPSYEFWDIIYGKSQSVIQKAIRKDNGEYSQYIGCPLNYYTCLDKDGNTRFVNYTDYLSSEDTDENDNQITHHTGLLQIELGSVSGESVIDSAKPEYILENNRISNDGFLMGFTYDKENDDYKIFYSPDEEMKDKYASEIGITKTAFGGEYNGFQTIGKERYLMSFRKAADYFVATAIPVSSLYYSCVATSMLCTEFTLVILLIITLCMVFSGELHPASHEAEAAGAFVLPVRNEKTGKWSIRNHSLKFETILRNGLIVLGIIFLLTVIAEGKRYGSDSAFFYILSSEWDRGVHIFSLSACFLIVIVSVIGMKMLGYVVYQIATVFGNSAVTMIRLIISLLKVFAIAIIIMYCLFLLGIDATSLLASAGILSVVVGMGSQSLVGDLLAGIFIIMEGSLHVGDYVTIDGVRGKVLEIGLRTTKFEDNNQNIHVVCNNQIKAFSNMSRKYSVVFYNIPVPYQEDYPAIRKTLNDEFLRIYEEKRFLKGIPSCLGIEEFGESSVNLCVRFICEEGDRYMVQRFMYDEIMRIFMENGITVPFNQIDVHVEKELMPAIRDER